MKHLPIILITILLTSCGLKSKMETNDKAQKEVDFIIENFTNYDLIKDKLPEKYFQPSQTKEFISNIDQSCDWANRREKFVDFFNEKYRRDRPDSFYL